MKIDLLGWALEDVQHQKIEVIKRRKQLESELYKIQWFALPRLRNNERELKRRCSTPDRS